MNTGYLFGLPYAAIMVNSQEIDVLIDTGFNGWLMLPSPLIERLRLENIGPTEYVMADGTTSETELYSAEVEWLGERKEITVVASSSDFALLGMELLYGAKIQMRPAKNVLTIERDG